MTPTVANMDPGVNIFHLLFIEGPKLNSTVIPKNRTSIIISHLPNKIISAAELDITSKLVRYEITTLLNMINPIAIINIKDNIIVRPKDNSLCCINGLVSLIW